MSDDKDWWSKAPFDRLRIRAVDDPDIRLLVQAYGQSRDRLAALSSRSPAPQVPPQRSRDGTKAGEIDRLANQNRDLRAALSCIAHTLTEDMKPMPSRYYQDIARAALSPQSPETRSCDGTEGK